MSALALNSIGASPGPAPKVNSAPLPSEAPPPFAPPEQAPKAATEPAPAKVLAALAPDNTRLSIVHDEATGRYVFKSINQETGEVIRQYPTEDMLSQIARMRQVAGLTVDTDA